ncbi:choice-of-anchor L domain-containing protein [Enhygromyxa salina]|uniref:choice-of-anchor L domain-containing protein n=1 Tax=Enhygromyxa salina TaxID=215803 RepID=UPI002158E0B0|nr:choice-of-anchor L domain-containing protein [Enhygromyxa salina]
MGLSCSLALVFGCADDSVEEAGLNDDTGTSTGTGDGDGDGSSAEGMDMDQGDGDGDPGDGDGDTGDGDGDTGDGDGDTGDGDGDTGDGDGDTGDGDGDTGDGDGDTGDGDGDTTGDGDGDTGTTGNPGACQAPSEYVDCDGTPDDLTTDPFQALGVNCGDDPASTVIAENTTMNSNNDNAWRIATQFGSADGDNYNGKLWAANDADWENPDMEVIDANTSTAILVLSTGVVEEADDQGVVIEAPGSQGGNGDNGNEDNGGLPDPLSANYGSNMGMGGTPFEDCDLANDCSDSLYEHWYVNGWSDPNDKLWMQMDLQVPVETEGYVFDFAYFSSEFPAWYETAFNDLFIAWSTSESYTGNITFVNDAPLTITSLEDANAFQYKDDAPELAGTGFEGNAGTGWFVARGSVVPEETFQLTFFIADMEDSQLATGVLLDNLRWECAGCIPNEVNNCGIQPQ